MIETEILIRVIDEFLVELGTASIVDAKKARDQLMDLRLMLMTSVAEIIPDTVEECL